MLSEDLLLVSPAQPDVSFRQKGTEKAMRILGRDSSLEKVMSTLGVDEKAVQQAELERVERMEMKIAIERSLSSGLKNKRDTQKALDVLGHDPSSQKAMNTLGVDETVIEEAKSENSERIEEAFVRKRKNSGNCDKKHSLKALERLGHDPSQQKVMVTLGLDEQDLEEVQNERIMEYEEQQQRKRSNSWVNKKESKALEVLGLNPSRVKVAGTLGIEETDVNEALMEVAEREEARLKKKRMNQDIVNKKNNEKALKILGHDPSDIKLESMLGIDKERIVRERSFSTHGEALTREKRLFLSPTLLIFSAVSLVVSLFVYFYFPRS